MSTIAIVYDTKYGQTERIAEYAGQVARKQGHTAQVVRVGKVDALELAEAFIVLAPVFAEKHMSTIRRFVVRHHETLATRPTAFFSVSGAAGSTDPAERARAQKFAQDFVASTAWRPAVVASLGGAIAYPRYNFFLRFVIKYLSKKNGGPTDTSRTHELTDWSAVERATVELLTAIAPKTAAETARAPFLTDQL